MRFLFLFALACLLCACDCCTTLIAGRLATSDGSTLAAHTDDGLTDPRIMHIPARSHEPNSHRAVYPSPEVYPRYVGYERAPAARCVIVRARSHSPFRWPLLPPAARAERVAAAGLHPAGAAHVRVLAGHVRHHERARRRYSGEHVQWWATLCIGVGVLLLTPPPPPPPQAFSSPVPSAAAAAHCSA
jgi:hypothetical protein